MLFNAAERSVFFRKFVALEQDMRYRRNHNYTEKELKDYQKWSRKFRRIVLLACMALVGGVGIVEYKVSEHSEMARQEAIAQQQIAQQACRQRMAEQEAREYSERMVWDSIRRAKEDSIAALPPSPPRYTWNELENMVRAVAKENYFAYIWKMDEDCWMMHYTTGEGKNTRHYFRKINAQKKTYGPVMRMKSPEFGVFYLASNPKHRYVEKGSCLVYYVGGVEKGRWEPRRSIDLFTPEDPRDEGYDSWEDYYNDNEEDLYFYYHGS